MSNTETQSEKLSEEVSETSKTIEDFTEADFRQHLSDTFDSVQIPFDATATNLAKLPTFIFNPHSFEGVISPKEALTWNIGALVRKELKVRRREEEDGDCNSSSGSSVNISKF